MINITVNTPQRCAGLYSLFLQFDFNPVIIEIIKQFGGAIYDKKTHIWEIDSSILPQLLDKLIFEDDVKLNDCIVNKQQDTQIDIQSDNFKIAPFDYQLEGIKYGINHDNFLLLDAPGLGKTLQLIYVAEQRKRINNITHCLIICGINSLKQNWKKEIEKTSNYTCLVLGDKINSKGKIINQGIKYRVKQLQQQIDDFFVITNIETLRDDNIIKQLKSGPNKFEMIIVDEIHTCKTPTSQQTKNLLKLISAANYRVGATGTVITNSPLDAYVPLKWIGREASNFSTFKNYYIQYGGLFNNEIIGYKNIETLKTKLTSVSLRRQKNILSLPEKTVIHEYLDMSPAQQLFYDNIVQGIFSDLDKIELKDNQVLSLVQRLRQATSSPSMLTSANIESTKIQRAVDLCEQIVQNNNKVVVFSVFKETLRQLQSKLQKYNATICSGDFTNEDISEFITKFQNDSSSKILLCTTQKLGTGVTLTAASYMIFIDCPWTAAQCQQCEDRIHRIGSNNSVFIYYLWNNNSIDLDVKQIVDDKSLVEDYIIDNKINQNFMERLRKLIYDLKF